jgi:fermentation-respiration switch protein FrsA (DUF1100 family)
MRTLPARKRRCVMMILSIFVALTVTSLGVWGLGSLLTSRHGRAIGPLPTYLHGQTVCFHADPDETLSGWFLPGHAGRGGVILFHGVYGSRLDMIGRAQFLNAAGYAVLLFDFRACGESSGTSSTFGFLETKDVRAALIVMQKLAPGEALAAIATSLGAAAVVLAGPQPGLRAVVLESMYPTLHQAIKNRIIHRVGSWAGFLTPLLECQLTPRLGFSADDLRPIDGVAGFGVPILIIAGGQDPLTPLAESMAIYDRAHQPKELWVIPDAAHVDFHALARTEYERRILDYLGTRLR